MGMDGVTEVLGFRTSHLGAAKQRLLFQEAHQLVLGISKALREGGHDPVSVLMPLHNLGVGSPTPSELEDKHNLVEILLNAVGLERLIRLMDIMGLRDKELRDFRQAAKAAIFGIIYGIGPSGLAVQITNATGKRCSPEEAKPIIESIKHEAYPGIGIMVERLKKTVKAWKYVRTLMGRYRHPAGAWSGNNRRIARMQRQAGNSPIQGLAAGIMQVVMIELHNHPVWKKMEAKIVMQIHDELLSLTRSRFAQEALDLKLRIMETAHRLETPVPLIAEGGYAKMWGLIK